MLKSSTPFSVYYSTIPDLYEESFRHTHTHSLHINQSGGLLHCNLHQLIADIHYSPRQSTFPSVTQHTGVSFRVAPVPESERPLTSTLRGPVRPSAYRPHQRPSTSVIETLELLSAWLTGGERSALHILHYRSSTNALVFAFKLHSSQDDNAVRSTAGRMPESTFLGPGRVVVERQ